MAPPRFLASTCVVGRGDGVWVARGALDATSHGLHVARWTPSRQSFLTLILSTLSQSRRRRRLDVRPVLKQRTLLVGLSPLSILVVRGHLPSPSTNVAWIRERHVRVSDRIQLARVREGPFTCKRAEARRVEVRWIQILHGRNRRRRYMGISSGNMRKGRRPSQYAMSR